MNINIDMDMKDIKYLIQGTLIIEALMYNKCNEKECFSKMLTEYASYKGVKSFNDLVSLRYMRFLEDANLV